MKRHALAEMAVRAYLCFMKLLHVSRTDFYFFEYKDDYHGLQS